MQPQFTSTPKYAHVDTRKPDGFYVRFERVIVEDDNSEAPDERDEGFWPSRDPQSAGYVGKVRREQYEEQQRAATERMEAWKRGDWSYVGVRARAHCLIVVNGVGTILTLDSPGLWGTESDSNPAYLDEIFEEEKTSLLAIIEAMRNPIVEA